MLYTSVGHAGASGYLAAMALVGLAPETMRPAALVLNVFVATLASVRYLRAGRFSWRLFWPLALAAAPMAFVGGAVQLPSQVFRALVGVALLLAAWRLWLAPKAQSENSPTALDEVHPPPLLPVWIVVVLVGGWIGSELGARRLATPKLRRLLAVVLVIAALKLLLS